MLFHDEVRPAKPIPTGGNKPAKKQLDGAIAVIEELSTDWEPERYTDCYRERLKRVIQRRLHMGVGDGVVKADGVPIYSARELKVGLFSPEQLEAQMK